jgi:hypothetical protein
LKLVVLQSRPGRSREVISERTFEIKHRSIHSKPNGFWHVSFSCQRTGFLSGRKATADSESVTPGQKMSR